MTAPAVRRLDPARAPEWRAIGLQALADAPDALGERPADWRVFAAGDPSGQPPAARAGAPQHSTTGVPEIEMRRAPDPALAPCGRHR